LVVFRQDSIRRRASSLESVSCERHEFESEQLTNCSLTKNIIFEFKKCYNENVYSQNYLRKNVDTYIDKMSKNARRLNVGRQNFGTQKVGRQNDRR
jgi:hypothetical protein